LGLFNEVNQHRARLVLGSVSLVTDGLQVNHLGMLLAT